MKQVEHFQKPLQNQKTIAETTSVQIKIIKSELSDQKIQIITMKQLYLNQVKELNSQNQKTINSFQEENHSDKFE